MTIDVRLDVFTHNDVDQLTAKLDVIIAALQSLNEKVIAMSAELDALSTAVHNSSTVIDSTVTLLNGIAARIAQLSTDPTALLALADEVNAKASALGAAVANVPPAP